MPTEEDYMRRAIGIAKQSRSEDTRPHPRVGAVLVLKEQVFEAYRGQLSQGDHAEFTVLERRLADRDLEGATLYTTLEPCTTRFHPKSPCAHRIASRRIGRVVIGMMDPNPAIYGNGVDHLRRNGIKVEFFPPSMEQEIENDNIQFAEHYLQLKPNESVARRLDDHFYTINAIYFDRNYHRDASSIFAHLVEIMGGLSLLATQKRKAGVVPQMYIPKAIAWWLALCGKVGVRSVEDLLWSKFPYACAYCMKCPHVSSECQEIKRKNPTPNWMALHDRGLKETGRRPATIRDWQRMFAEIYPTQQTENYDTVFGRFTEELGELAEAVRVFQIGSAYFVSEAADVFAWLMHLANLIEEKSEIPIAEHGRGFEKTFCELYPDRCKDCNNPICTCPPILPSTLGRIAHEGPDDTSSGIGLFLPPAQSMARFGLSAKPVVIGDQRIDIGPEMSDTIGQSIRTVIALLTSAKIRQRTMRRLSVIFQQIAFAASMHRLSGERVDDLSRAIRHLPENERQEVVRILKEIPESLWINAIRNFAERCSSRTP